MRKRADQVAPPQLDPVDADRPRRVVYEPLDQYAASGRPAPRYGPVGTLFVRAPRIVTEQAGMS